MRVITIRKKVREKQEAKPLSSKIRESVDEYGSNSTIHGLRYITDPKIHSAGKIFWFLVGIISLSLTGYQIFCLQIQWRTQDATITTLETLNLPIDQIEFPSVTICPQGSVKSISKGIAFREFVQWIQTKSRLVNRRIKRSSSLILPEPWNMTYIEIMEDLKKFTKDFYGLVEGSPVQLASMLNSENPEQMLYNEALLFPNGEKYCDEFTEEELEDEINQALNQNFCPSGFSFIKGIGCVMPTNFQMTFNEAVAFCNSFDKDASVLRLDSPSFEEKMSKLEEHDIFSKFLFLSFITETFQSTSTYISLALLFSNRISNDRR